MTEKKTGMGMGRGGTKLVQDFEKLRKHMYDNDGGGHCTIGWGHKIHRGQCDGRENEKVFKSGISKGKADHLLKADMKTAVSAVNNAMKNYGATPNQNQFDAMVSFTYNAGQGSLRKMPSGAADKNGNLNLANVPDRMKLYHKSGGKIS